MANLETWLAEENSIIQKPDNEKQAYLYEWLERLHEQLNRGTISTVSRTYTLPIHSSIRCTKKEVSH